ncbi:phenylacetate--CoA ligase family protein [Halobaculum sp. EA56]|uniref:phenylacetate--CoA ligase family protein n=1 Tax=Halobaculum sp. EA56 TaxID=3421648 RepID=UPI003EB835D7
MFDKQGLSPSDIQTVDDLSKLPRLTKDDIRQNYQRLQAQNVDDAIVHHTSGSTGEPFSFKQSTDIEQIERAFINRAFSAHGTDLYHEKTVWLRSYSPEEHEPIYKYEPHLGILFLSPFHLSPDRLNEYVELINSFGASTLVGYPSSVYIFATLLKDSDLSLDHIDVVHTGSENFLPEWRDRVESILGVPAKDHYGMAEKVGLFHQCSESYKYHENLEYGVVEIVDRNNGTGQIVGTSLWNYAMPLIRYEMGDKATINKGSTTCDCGRGLPLTVERFEGRTDDILRTPDGRLLPAVNFYTLMYDIEGVEMFKLLQTAVDHVEVRLVVSDSFDKSNEAELRSGLNQRLGDNIDIQIQYTDIIERDPDSGKIRCVESRIN